MRKDITENFNYDYLDKFQMEDVENRRLCINGEIDADVIDTIVYHIMRYNRIDKDISIEERKPIIVYINSPGGSLVEGYSIIDIIEASKTPVYTVNIGECCSMGLLIFIAGKERYSFRHGEFLLHDGSSMCAGSTSKLKDRMEFEAFQLERMTKEYILERTAIGEDLYDKRYRDEWYFLPKEGKTLGVVDYIIGEDCTIDEVC